MIRNVKNKYKKYLNDKKLIDHIISDLRKVQGLTYEDDTSLAIELFFEKYSSENKFLEQFNESYYKDHKKNWLRSRLSAGISSDNNGLERYNANLKLSLTFQQKLSARELLENLIECVRQESEDNYMYPGMDTPTCPFS